MLEIPYTPMPPVSHPTQSRNPPHASGSGPTITCSPFGLLVCPDLVCLSDFEESSEVPTGARRKPHCIPLLWSRFVVSCRILLVHSDDQVSGTLDGAEYAIEFCSSRRDSDAQIGARGPQEDLKGRSVYERIIMSGG